MRAVLFKVMKFQTIMERVRTVLKYQYIKFHIKSVNLTTLR